MLLQPIRAILTVSLGDMADHAFEGSTADNPMPADVTAVRLINLLRFILMVIYKIMSNHAHGILKFSNLTREQGSILFLITNSSVYLFT
jgi:hypothetical protein